MTLATKNNAIIIKDGKFAESCACCGQTCESILAQEELVISVVASDRIAFVKNTFDRTLGLCPAGTEWCQTLIWPGEDYSGTFALSKISAFPARWRYTYPVSAPVCGNSFSGTPPFLQLEASQCSSSNEIYFAFVAQLYTLWYQDRNRGGTCSQRSKNDFDCVLRTGNANCGGGSNFISSNSVALTYSTQVTALASDTNPTAFPVINGVLTTSQFLQQSGVQANVSGTISTTTDTGNSGGSAVAVSFVPQ